MRIIQQLTSIFYNRNKNIKKMLMGQIDDLITKSLTNNLPAQNFKLLGSSNGIILDSIFSYKTMVYINVHVVNDRLVYDLSIVSLETRTNDENQLQMVRKIPIIYSGQLTKNQVDSGVNIDRVEVEMKQSPHDELILIVKISVLYKNQYQSKDILSLLILDPDHLKRPDTKNFHLIRLKSGDTRIYDFDWHPLSEFTLVTLLSNESIQIWDIRQQDFMRPTQIIKSRSLKESQSLSPSIKFTSFAILSLINQPSSQYNQYESKLNLNKFTLFLLNSIGEVISLFPFLPVGSLISKEDYDIIYGKEDETEQVYSLKSYLSHCKLQQIQTNYIISQTPVIQNHCSVRKWLKSTTKYKKYVDITKLAKQQHYYRIKLFRLSEECMLVLQAVNRSYVSFNSIWISMIFKSVSNKQENVIHQIAQIKNQLSDKENDVRFISSECKLNKVALRQFKCVFYTEKNSLYKLDLSSLFKFLQTNNLVFLQQDNCFPVSLIFSLPENQSLTAMAIEQQLNCINFVRRSRNKIKFQIITLRSLNMFSQIQNISRCSRDLLKRLQALKVQEKNYPLNSQREKKTQLKFSPQKISQYKTKGIQKMKDDYKIYCNNLTVIIDQGMRKLKVNYELMRKKLKQFNQFKNRKKQLNILMEKVQSNNNKIHQMLFNERQQERAATGELGDLQKNINSVNSLLNTVKSKQLNVQKSKNVIIEQIDNLSNKLKQVRSKLQQAKKTKKDLQNQNQNEI